MVYRWSDGKAFTLALRAEEISGERNWPVPIRLRDTAGAPLAAGVYTATAHLTTLGRTAWSASVRFTVTAP